MIYYHQRRPYPVDRLPWPTYRDCSDYFIYLTVMQWAEMRQWLEQRGGYVG